MDQPPAKKLKQATVAALFQKKPSTVTASESEPAKGMVPYYDYQTPHILDLLISNEDLVEDIVTYQLTTWFITNGLWLAVYTFSM